MRRSVVGRLVLALSASVVIAVAGGCGGGSDQSTGVSVAPPVGGAGGSTSTSQPAPDPATVEKAIRDYYSAITGQDFQSAWAMLTPTLQDAVHGLDAWTGMYKQTKAITATSIDVASISADAATANVTLRIVDTDACQARVTQHFAGTWKLVRQGGGWLADDITTRKTSGGTPATNASSCGGTGGTGGAGAQTKGGGPTQHVCYPGVDLPAVHLPGVTLPAVPSLGIPAQHIAGQTIPGSHIAGTCVDVPQAFAPQNTTVADPGAYSAIDPQYSPDLTSRYWGSAPTTANPDPTAPGFGQLNAAGYPKNQYVRPYMKRDGTQVGGYWRNGASARGAACRSPLPVRGAGDRRGSGGAQWYPATVRKIARTA